MAEHADALHLEVAGVVVIHDPEDDDRWLQSDQAVNLAEVA